MNDGGSGPIIRLRRVSVGYGAECVLRDITLDIPGGVFLPFVGPNGAGKTTLLRAILGLLPVKAGTIETPFADEPPGYVAQQKAIDPIYPVSVQEIVEMGCWPLRRSRSIRERRALVERQLERFGLLEHAGKTFGELSGGMRQKALLARALVAEPRVIVMDEPTTELDQATQRMVLDTLHAAARGGCTVLIAHHGLDAIVNRAEKVCLVRDGSVRMMPLSEVHF